jgi:hypothetical protein
MITAMLISTLSLAAAPPADLPIVQAEPPVRVWLSKKGSVRAGDRVRVYTRTQADGYLLVLHAEPDGRIRVLFPLDPFDDNFLRGGQDYELRGRGDREAFRVYESAGVGTILAAFSRDPFRFQAFVRGDHWDYRVFDQWRLTEDLDPETELTALVQEMAGGVPFTYDLTGYPVGEKVVYASTYYGGATTAWSVGFGVYPTFGVSFGWGWYDPWYGYYPYYAHYGYWYPYRPYYAYYPYYNYYPSCCYYPGYYPPSYYPPSSGTYYRGRYAWKHPSRYDLADGGVYQRRRTSPTSSAGLQANLSRRYATDYTTRRAPTATADNRRASPTTVQTTGRRASSPVQAGGRRSPAAARSTSLERRTVTQPTDDGRQVRASGWGITDGRRVVRPVERQSQPAAEPAARDGAQDRRTTITPARPESASDRTVRRATGGSATRTAPATADRSRSSALARRTEASRVESIRSQVSRVSPDRASTVRRQTATRATTPSRSMTRSAAPARRATPSLSRRSVTPSPSSAPRSSATQPRVSAPRPSVNRAPARVSRPAPSKPSSSRSSPPRRKQ